MLSPETNPKTTPKINTSKIIDITTDRAAPISARAVNSNRGAGGLCAYRAQMLIAKILILDFPDSGW